MRTAVAVYVGTLSLLLAACGGSTSPTPPPPPPPAAVATVEVAPPPGPLVPAQTLQLVAVTKDAAGNALSNLTVSWATDNATVASVSASGVVTAVAAGTATITATSEGKSGTASVTVRDGALIGTSGGGFSSAGGRVSIQVPAQALGSTTALLVTAVPSPPPNPKLVPGTGYDFEPAATQFATPATIKIQYDPALVAPNALVAQFRLHHWNGTGWDQIVGSTVDTTTKTVAGLVSSLGMFAVLEVPIPVAVVVPSDTSLTLAVGLTRQLSVILKDAKGNVLAGRSVTWTSTAPAVATVTSDGLVTAVAQGQAVVRATSEGLHADINVTIVPPISQSVIRQHQLSQVGLSIALASTVLQSQVYVLLMTGLGPAGQATACTAATGGGSYQSLPVGASGPKKAGVYFDANCTTPYVIADVTLDPASSSSEFILHETATYTDADGTTLGALKLDENAILNFFGGTSIVHGLGLFTPVGGAPPVSLGLACSVAGATSTIPCEGGVAQNIPALAKAFGSVTQINLSQNAANGVDFTGGSVLTSGALDALTLGAPTTTTLAIQGGTADGTATASGGAAAFALFPPTPTGWAVTDTTNDMKFQIDVVSNAVRNLVGTVTQISTGHVLATLALDQSGSGTIAYSDGTSGPVVSWLLTK